MKISHSQIETQCKMMRKTSENIETILNDINGSLYKLQSIGCWQGRAYDFFYTKLKGVTDNFDDVIESINNNINYLENVLKNYSEFDKKIINNIINIFDGK